MDISNMFHTIYQGIMSLMPFFRIAWISTLLLGAAMIMIALLLKRNPERKKSPWIVGTLGLLMLISSGTQLIGSMF